MANFEKAYQKVRKDEGGFQNYSNDRANYCDGKLIGTNKGISAIGYKGYYGVCPTVEQMRNLTTEQAMAIYKKNYWDKLSLDEIKNDSVAAMMFQYIIGSGASQISDIKAIANKTGNLGLAENDSPLTIAEAKKINTLNQREFWQNLKDWRHAFYLRLVARNPDLAVFLKGWQRRLDSYVYEDTTDEKKN